MGQMVKQSVVAGPSMSASKNWLPNQVSLDLQMAEMSHFGVSESQEAGEDIGHLQEHEGIKLVSAYQSRYVFKENGLKNLKDLDEFVD